MQKCIQRPGPGQTRHRSQPGVPAPNPVADHHLSVPHEIQQPTLLRDHLPNSGVSFLASVRTQEKTLVLNLDPTVGRCRDFSISSLIWRYFKWFEIVTSLAAGNKAYYSEWAVAFGAQPHATDIAKYKRSNPTRRFAETV